MKVGSEHKIALQTMTTTDTRDVEGTVDQVRGLPGAPALEHAAPACRLPQQHGGHVPAAQLTRDWLGCQVMRCADVGADLVRITVQGMQEAKACGKIRDRLFQKG